MKAKSEQILPLFMPLAQVLYTEPTSDIIALKDSQTSQEFERGFKGGGVEDGRGVWQRMVGPSGNTPSWRRKGLK